MFDTEVKKRWEKSMMKRQFGPGNTIMVMLMNGRLGRIQIKIKKKGGKNE
jgi:hypothetical protein